MTGASGYKTLSAMATLLATSACAAGTEPPAEPQSHGVAVYALSRGAGVPDATRAAYQRAREILEEDKRSGAVISIEEARIGLEGEQRLCAQFKERAAADIALERLRAVSAGIELLNVKEEPCRPQR
jgi:hypothetical protein